MTLGQCVPYSFATEFQRMRDCLAILGCDAEPAASKMPVNISMTQRVIIHGSFQDLLIFDVPDNKKFQMTQVFVSLIGFSCEFVVEYTRTLLNWDLLRSYCCNTQSPNYQDTLSAVIEKLPRDDQNSYSRFRVRARMNGGAGDNLNGSVFVTVSGFMIPYP